METPRIPIDEDKRLNALKNLNILDTLPEERFDRITRMAQKIFGVNIALVSLVDSNRQWFKSKQGIDASETSREVSFCGHAILDDELLEINDTETDTRFNDNPLVTGNPHIRFYVGCPLKTFEGYKVGTLCLIDSKPRELDDSQKALLKDFAKMIEDELEGVKLAFTDELTGLTNRRGFLHIGEKVLPLCKRIKRNFYLLFFDLNKFKEINDTLGHQMGDQILQEFAQALIREFRESDVIARLGGDEFVVIATGVTDIKIPIERLRKNIQIKVKDSQLSFSIGFSQYDPQKHDCLEDILNDADKKMYDEKENY